MRRPRERKRRLLDGLVVPGTGERWMPAGVATGGRGGVGRICVSSDRAPSRMQPGEAFWPAVSAEADRAGRQRRGRAPKPFLGTPVLSFLPLTLARSPAPLTLGHRNRRMGLEGRSGRRRRSLSTAREARDRHGEGSERTRTHEGVNRLSPRIPPRLAPRPTSHVHCSLAITIPSPLSPLVAQQGVRHDRGCRPGQEGLGDRRPGLPRGDAVLVGLAAPQHGDRTRAFL